MIIYKTIETSIFNVNNNSFSGRYRDVRETGSRPGGAVEIEPSSYSKIRVKRRGVILISVI